MKHTNTEIVRNVRHPGFRTSDSLTVEATLRRPKSQPAMASVTRAAEKNISGLLAETLSFSANGLTVPPPWWKIEGPRVLQHQSVSSTEESRGIT